MSHENLEIVRNYFDAFRGGFDLDAAAEFWHPDIRWRAIEGAPDDVGEIRGHAELRAYYEQWVETFDGIEAEPEELVDGGDSVVAQAHVRGRMKGSDAEIDMRVGVVYTLRAGVVVRGREYATMAEALEAAGLSEEPMSPG